LLKWKRYLFLGGEEKIKDNNEILSRKQKDPCKLSQGREGNTGERVSNI
jgi:hypothetical protein